MSVGSAVYMNVSTVDNISEALITLEMWEGYLTP